MFNKHIIEYIDTDEVVQKVIKELKKKKVPTKKLIQDLPPTIKIKWANKKKGLIVCNACSGKGKEDDRYGEKTNCRFCEGSKVIKLDAS